MINRNEIRKGIHKGRRRVSMFVDSYMPRECRLNRLESWSKKYRKTTKSCSGFCCGNRRKWMGKTLQERRFEDRIKLELLDIEIEK